VVLPFRRLNLCARVEGNNGLRFLVEIEGDRVYEPFPTSASSGVSVLFDVGANCGILAITRCLDNPSLHAVCFEPHPATAERLAANVRLNGLERRIRVAPCAVGARAGELPLAICPTSSMGTVLTGGCPAAGQSTITVPVVTLDGFAQANGMKADALKIDVEGFEEEVLTGAGRVLAAARYVVLETHSEPLAEACSRLLRDLGFAIERRDRLLFGNRP
jgi:FkbM family methyltransferase